MIAAGLQEILGPLAASETAWCGFDAAWYRSAYGAAHPGLAEATDEAALVHYIETGRALALSPNLYFDEPFYRATNPEIAASIAGGEIGSGYEHYCAVGYLTRAPHWLYDDATYALYAPDLTDQVLVTFRCANRYDHYLKAGAREGRIAHLLFQPAIYRQSITGNPDGDLPGANSPYQHFLQHIRNGGDAVTSVYFDPTFYTAPTQAARGWLCALHHFLAAPAVERGDPLPQFDARHYAAAYPEAAAAVAAGRFESLYAEFLTAGVFTLNAPTPTIDLRAYLDATPAARATIESGEMRDLFAYFLLNLPVEEPATVPVEPTPAEPTPAEPSRAEPSRAEPTLAEPTLAESVAVTPAHHAPAAPVHAHPTGETFGSHLLLEIDDAILCPPDGLVLIGWMLAPPGSIRALKVISGSRTIVLDPTQFVRNPRTDVLARFGAAHGYSDPLCGFLAYVPGAIEPGERPFLEITRASGEVAMRNIIEPKLHGIAAIRELLGLFELRYSALAPAFDHAIGPAIMALSRARLAERPDCDAIVFGTPDPAPEVSIIIPLYGRIDLMEYQLALFSAHPPGISHELIYVLDDPSRRRDAEALAISLHARFALPFRLLLLSRNMGYAPANNIGLAHASGRYVCLLNSDVFPQREGWLGALTERLRDTPEIAAIGPLLLYEDGSVQHMGMAFEPLPEFAGWMFPLHEHKGRRPPATGGLRTASAITGACLLIARATLQNLGGLDETYTIGDFEDADLCMKLAERGLRCAVDLDVRMYHLERQSQAGSVERWRMNLTLYNAWLHQRRWGDRIAALPAPGMTAQARGKPARARKALTS